MGRQSCPWFVPRLVRVRMMVVGSPTGLIGWSAAMVRAAPINDESEFLMQTLFHQLLSQDRGIDDEDSGEPPLSSSNPARLRLLPGLTQHAQDVQCTSDNFLLFAIVARRL